jgi:hypothetical protein
VRASPARSTAFEAAERERERAGADLCARTRGVLAHFSLRGLRARAPAQQEIIQTDAITHMMRCTVEDSSKTPSRRVLTCSFSRTSIELIILELKIGVMANWLIIFGGLVNCGCDRNKYLQGFGTLHQIQK